jgi:hypothetical protein
MNLFIFFSLAIVNIKNLAIFRIDFDYTSCVKNRFERSLFLFFEKKNVSLIISKICFQEDVKMSQLQIEKIQKFFGMKRNKERLLNLLKREGEYLEFKEKIGYIYAVKIGEVEGGMDVMLKVAMLGGNLTVLDAFMREKQEQEIAS